MHQNKSKEQRLRSTAVKIDHEYLLYLSGVAQYPLIKACISYLVDQILGQQVSAELEIGSGGKQRIVWLEEYYKGGNKNDIRMMWEDLLTVGFCQIEYEEVSDEVPEMTVDYSENRSIMQLTTKNRMTYTNTEKEKRVKGLTTPKNLINSCEKIAYVPRRVSPLTTITTFIPSIMGLPERFFVYPLFRRSGMSLINTTSMDEPMANVRVFFLPETFITFANFSKSGMTTGISCGVLSDVSRILDLYERAFELEKNSESVIVKSSNPSYYVFKPRDTVYDSGAAELSKITFGNTPMTPRENANYRAMNSRAENSLVHAIHNTNNALQVQHKKFLQGLLKGDEYAYKSISKESWYQQIPYAPPPGYQIGFWPQVPFNDSFIKFVEKTETTIAMIFGVTLSGLMGKSSGNTTAEQAMKLMKEVNRHKMNEINSQVQSLLTFVVHDCLKASISLDIQEDMLTRSDIRDEDKLLKDEEEESEEESEDETSSSSSSSSSSESETSDDDDKKDDVTPKAAERRKKMTEKKELKKEKDRKLKEKYKAAKQKAKMKIKEQEKKERAKLKEDKKRERIAEKEFTRTPREAIKEIMNTLTFTIDLVSPLPSLEEMVVLRNCGAVTDYNFNMWASTKYQLPFQDKASKVPVRIENQPMQSTQQKLPTATSSSSSGGDKSQKPKTPKPDANASSPSSSSKKAPSASKEKEKTGKEKPKETPKTKPKSSSSSKGSDSEDEKPNAKKKPKSNVPAEKKDKKSSTSSKKKGGNDSDSDIDSDNNDKKERKKPQPNSDDKKEKGKDKEKKKPHHGKSQSSDDSDDSEDKKPKKKENPKSKDGGDSTSSSTTSTKRKHEEKEKKPKKKRDDSGDSSDDDHEKQKQKHKKRKVVHE